ncbi:AraC family transcriptional regulator [Salinivibrio sp. MA440]|uniref:helix-turn-helix transcriptional regulator n=1 Tax=Salinivibrio sp. MA440 TaxID=1909456 RepID=UPI000988D97F|nr:AraC family transcriptional regulator [Salinivibrio sp. MA440]OOF02137.1 AraC family transcriptional regulator [Salinivibrio sp. MA440]
MKASTPTSFSHLLELLKSPDEQFGRVIFANDWQVPEAFSYQVNFPRLEIVVSGQYTNIVSTPEGVKTHTLVGGEALYIAPNCWNKPDWQHSCSVLSLLYGRRQLGFSLVNKRANVAGFYGVQKFSVPMRAGFAVDNILEALNALAKEPNKHLTDGYLIKALLAYTHQLVDKPIFNAHSRGEDLYQGICIYIQEHYQQALSRADIAAHFHISPSHLSRLFKQYGHMTLADYIVWVRIDRAKFMLMRYEFRLVDIACRCGFNDVNYFCRVFKARTGKTPSEYRRLSHQS